MTSMEPTVRMQRHGGIAVLTIDNPLVNALSHSVRVGLLEILSRIEADDGVRAILPTAASMSRPRISRIPPST